VRWRRRDGVHDAGEDDIHIPDKYRDRENDAGNYPRRLTRPYRLPVHPRLEYYEHV